MAISKAIKIFVGYVASLIILMFSMNAMASKTYSVDEIAKAAAFASVFSEAVDKDDEMGAAVLLRNSKYPVYTPLVSKYKAYWYKTLRTHGSEYMYTPGVFNVQMHILRIEVKEQFDYGRNLVENLFMDISDEAFLVFVAEHCISSEPKCSLNWSVAAGKVKFGNGGITVSSEYSKMAAGLTDMERTIVDQLHTVLKRYNFWLTDFHYVVMEKEHVLFNYE
jgi:hypothetical protein